jgi:UDP-N-acetylglucosamine 3-dehydrogenase
MQPKPSSLPNSDITIVALGTLLDNPGVKYAATDLHGRVERLLGRKVNYSGLLKQIRTYAAQPGWNRVLFVERQPDGRVFAWAEKNPLSKRMGAVVRGLFSTMKGLEAFSKWESEYKAERDRIFSDPYYSVGEARPRLAALDAKLDSLISDVDLIDKSAAIDLARLSESDLQTINAVKAGLASDQPQNMNPIRIGVVGPGYWGSKVIREILEIGRSTGAIQLHSIVGHSPESLAKVQKEFGRSIPYAVDYEKLVSDPSLSGVRICTPNKTHFEIASRFLRHGKHVLVEKPLTLKSEEAYELVRLSVDNNCVLCVGNIHRFNNGVRELRRVIAEGMIGDPYYVSLRWTGFMNPQLQRDVITDLAPHPFDICNQVLEMWPEEISCEGRGYRTEENMEVAFITSRYKSGPIAHIEISWLDFDKRREITIIGSNGMAYLDCVSQKLFIEKPNGRREIRVLPSNTLASEIIHFADCIRNNRESTPYVNHEDGILGARIVSLLESCHESWRRDRKVRVELPLMGIQREAQGLPTLIPQTRTKSFHESY